MKPTLYFVPSFDSTKGTIINFSWLGNQPVSNTIRIRNNNTNVIIYEKTLQTMRLEHEIPANSGLLNGILYNVSVMVTDNNGKKSEWANTQLFYCYSTPTFKINIEPDQVIQAQTYGIDITYSQAEGELLQSYRVRVYNAQDAVIYDSNTRYALGTVKITNLQDNGHYYILATGETINGMAVSTDKISFSVDFIKSEAYFICELQNMYETGGIYIKSNITHVEGRSDKKLTYINNDIADLTNNVVHFDQDFSLSDDFTIIIKGYGFEKDNMILQLLGGKETITIEYKYHNGKYYFELVAKYKDRKYFLVTENLYHGKTITILVRRKDALLDMEVVL